MRIGVCVTNEYPIPIPSDVVHAPLALHYEISLHLAKLGHEVFFFCSEDSIIDDSIIKVSSGIPSTYKKKKHTLTESIACDHLLVSKMVEYSSENNLDIMWHNHPILSAPYLRFTTVPFLFTLHEPLLEMYRLLLEYSKYPLQYCTSISMAQRKNFPEFLYYANIHNGVDLNKIPYEEKPDDYFVSVGRVTEGKGTLDSINVALKAGVALKVIGPHSFTPQDALYWEKVQELIDGEQIEYLEALSQEELFPIIARAKGFINMIHVHESFGMTLIESMATGTPIIARNRGAVSEVIENGKTGFVVEENDEAVLKIAEIESISREYCREYVAENFSIEKSTREYEKIMKKIVEELA